MLAECRKVQPDAVVCFEEPNEHFIQQVGIQDYRDWEVFRSQRRAGVGLQLPVPRVPAHFPEQSPGGQPLAGRVVPGQRRDSAPGSPPGAGPGPLLAGGDFEKAVENMPAGWQRVPGYQGRATPAQRPAMRASITAAGPACGCRTPGPTRSPKRRRTWSWAGPSRPAKPTSSARGSKPRKLGPATPSGWRRWRGRRRPWAPGTSPCPNRRPIGPAARSASRCLPAPTSCGSC